MRNVLFSKADNKNNEENNNRSSDSLGQILFRGVFLIFALVVTVWVARAEAATTSYYGVSPKHGLSSAVKTATTVASHPQGEKISNGYIVVDCAATESSQKSPQPVIRFTPSPQHSIQSTFAVAKCGYRKKKKFAIQDWR